MCLAKFSNSYFIWATAPEWAASGAKLALPLHVQFSTTNKECTSYDELNQESLLMGDSLGVAKATTMSSSSSSCSTVMPLNEPSFISTKGQEIVKVTPGAFSCQIQVPDTEQYSFRFFLDFVSDNEWSEMSHLLFDLVSLFTRSHFLQPEGATRNDVVREIDTKFCIHNICIKNCISHFCPMHDNMQVLPAGRIFFVSTIIICCYIWRYSYAND